MTIPNKILNKQGCKQCWEDRRGDSVRSDTETFIKKAKSIHGDAIDYSETKYYGSKIKSIFICKIDGKKFMQRPNDHLSGYGCPKCKSSRGEKDIHAILEFYKISFVSQYKISDCKNRLSLPFDFAIFNLNNKLIGLIEYQGLQHFKPISYFGGEKSFNQQQKRDQIKRDYCLTHGIPLLEIPYWKKDDVTHRLNTFLQKQNGVAAPK